MDEKLIQKETYFLKRVNSKGKRYYVFNDQNFIEEAKVEKEQVKF